MYIEYGLSGIYDLEQRTEEKKTETQSDFGKMTDEQRAEFQKKFEEAKKAGKLPEFLKVSCDTTVISCGECDDKLSRSCRSYTLHVVAVNRLFLSVCVIALKMSYTLLISL